MISGKRPQLGDVKYIDTDNNGQITADDRQFAEVRGQRCKCHWS